jgi:DNA polymerase III delta prime subunit
MIDINKEYADMGWDDVIGLSITPVLAEWQGTTLPRVVLFHGPYGCGKNLLAYLFAKKLPNVEITVRNTVDNTAKGAEAMIAQFSAPPLLPDVHQVCILNEFTSFRKDAMAKFKDILQAPPERTYFFICTNEPEKIVPDVDNRFGFRVEVTLLNETNAYHLTHKMCSKHSVDLTKVKKRAIARGSGGRPRTIIKTIEAIADSGDKSDSFIKNMLDTYAGEGNEQAFMELFYYLSGQKYFKGQAYDLIKLINETGMEADSIRYKLLHMVYNRYHPKAKPLFLSLIPPLGKGGEKFDLLARFMKLLKL